MLRYSKECTCGNTLHVFADKQLDDPKLSKFTTDTWSSGMPNEPHERFTAYLPENPTWLAPTYFFCAKCDKKYKIGWLTDQ